MADCDWSVEGKNEILAELARIGRFPNQQVEGSIPSWRARNYRSVRELGRHAKARGS